VSSAKAGAARGDPVAGDSGALAKLLHALNQPLTGLQCSLELALCRPRTAGQYAACLRGGLELTERMRHLVGAMRELMEIEGAAAEMPETIELRSLLCETVAELQPVVEEKGMRVAVDCAALPVDAGRRGLSASLFRVLESGIALAAPGSELSIRSGPGPALSIGWRRAGPAAAPGEFSPAQLGLLLAQAGLRRAGVDATRELAQEHDLIVLRPRRDDSAGKL